MGFRFRLLVLWTMFCFARISGGQTVRAKMEFDLGFSAYKLANYEEAIRHLTQAVLLDPGYVPARLLLARGYAEQYISGVDSAANNEMGKQAIAQFEQVLALNPGGKQQLTALKGIAYLYLSMKQFQRSKEYNKQILTIDSRDPETLYAIAVADWAEAYQFRMQQRTQLTLKPEEPLIGFGQCWDLKTKNQDRVNEGIEMLTQAIGIRHDYDDAMAYMNLIYRERADIQCGNRRAYVEDERTADQWVDLTMATKKAKAVACSNTKTP